MRLLIFGKTGQVAQELARRLPQEVEATFLDRTQADLLHPQTCANAIRAHDSDVVINAAAWTAVDAAEVEERAATVVNGHAPHAMAVACASKGIPFLHLSSDYVFDGEGKGQFGPEHKTAPLGAYGRSKLFGEERVRSSGARHLIMRTSWVFSAHGSNFVKTMLRLGREREVVRVVADQIGGPTPASDIAEALYAVVRPMIEGHVGGTYHFAGAPDVSWADFARVTLTEAGLHCRIEDIPSSQYPTPARRPRNSRLDCSSFERDFGVRRPDWRVSLDLVLRELGAKT